MSLKKFTASSNLLCVSLQATENPDLASLKSWTEFTQLDSSSQEKFYNGLVEQLRRVTNERNSAIQVSCVNDQM